MANEEQLSILKQGVEAWNKWRTHNRDVYIDLFEVDLGKANLRKIDLSDADLLGAYLAIADLSEAVLSRANLFGAELSHANLRGASLDDTKFYDTTLMGADFTDAKLGYTIFGSLDLSEVLGLEHISPNAPSTLGTDTMVLSKGKIPEVFLRGCGLSDWEIEMVKLYDPNLSNEERNKVLYRIHDLQANQAIQISPLFISYSRGDGVFVEKLETKLNNMGIRFWRDVHDMKSGRMEKQIDRAIRQNPTVLLVLSEHSLASDWVEHEVRTARGVEKEMGRDVLCPVALDDSWKSSHWPKRVMEQIMEYNILDFSGWEDAGKFDGMFRKLIDGLELFYKG